MKVGRLAALRGVRSCADETAAEWAALVGTSSSAIVRLSVGGRIESWNRGAEELSGLAAHEAIGHGIAILEPRGVEVFAEPVQTAAAGRQARLETVIHRRDGRRADVEVSVAPIFGRGPEVTGVLWVAVDITERRRADRVRECALADLHEAQRVARIGSWSCNPTTGETSWSPQMYEICGRDPQRGPAGVQELLECVHPDDRRRAADGWAQALERSEPVALEHRIIASGGVVRTVELLGRVDPDRPGWYRGTLHDVTAQRRGEADLRHSEQRLRTIFDGAPIGVALARATAPFELVQANVSLGELLGIAPAQLAGRPAEMLIEASDRELARGHLQRLTAGQECASHLELSIRGHAGDLRSVSVSGAMIAGEGGQAGHLVLQVQDITERKRLELELRRSAERDPLTGLLNRRGLDHELAGALADNELYGTPATILACDLDNLKPVNDTLGHRAGDALLVAVAGKLAELVHDSGVVARTGGDEFLVLLAGTGPGTAGAIAEQLRASVSALALPGLPPTSISIGMSALGDGLGAEDALIAADYAMYEAKRKGASRMAFSRQVSTAEITATPSEPWRREQSR